MEGEISVELFSNSNYYIISFAYNHWLAQKFYVLCCPEYHSIDIYSECPKHFFDRFDAAVEFANKFDSISQIVNYNNDQKSRFNSMKEQFLAEKTISHRWSRRLL